MWPKEHRGQERVTLRCPHLHLSIPGAGLGALPPFPVCFSSRYVLFSTQKRFYFTLESETEGIPVKWHHVI